MDATVHFSGSAGNLYTVEATNGKRLMLEMGVAWSKIQEALDYKIDNVEGALISHADLDHAFAHKKVLQAGFDVFASRETWEALGYQEDKMWRRCRVVADGIISELPSFQVYSFEVPHDSPGAMGYVVREKESEELLLFVTDFHYIPQVFPWKFDIIMIAVNYDKKILQARVDSGSINEELAKRIVFSHPEKEMVKRYLRDSCDLSRCRALYLLHASAGNLDRPATCKEFSEEFFIDTR